MAVSLVAGSPVVSNGATGTAVATATPTLPAGTTTGDTDRVFIFAVGTTTATIATPTGWTSLLNVAVGSGTLGAGTGARRVAIFYRDRDTAWAMPAVPQPSQAAPTIAVSAVTLRKPSAEQWDAPVVASGTDPATGAAFSATGGSLAQDTGGYLLACLALPTNPTSVSSPNLTTSGVAYGALATPVAFGGSQTGNDAYQAVYGRAITTGATAAPTLAATLGASMMGGAGWVEQSSSSPVPVTYASLAFTGANGSAPVGVTGTLINGATRQVQNNAMVFTGPVTASVSAGPTVLNVTPVSDSEMTVDFTLSSLAEQYLSFSVRADATLDNWSSPQNGYHVALTPSVAGAKVNRIVAYTTTTLYTRPVTWAINTVYHFRFRVVGALVSFRLWVDGAAEPTTWDYSATDATPYLTAGVPVFGYANGAVAGAKTVTIDNWTLTNGVVGAAPVDTTAPTPPTLTATPVSPTQVNLSWSGATDAVGVAGYIVKRGGTVLDPAVIGTSYSDTTAPPGTTSSYTVQAYDSAGNTSVDSNAATATTAAAPVIPAKWATYNSAAAQVATRPFRYMSLGDSISEGQGASTRAKRWVSLVTAEMRARYQPAGVVGGENYIPAWNGVYAPDSTWAAPTSQTGTLGYTGTDGSLGYRELTFQTGATATYTVVGTSMDLWYATGGGSFSYRIDGGAATTVSATGTYQSAMKVNGISLGAAGTHTVVITGVSGPVKFQGITVYNGDSAAGVQHYDSAQSGYKTSDFLLDRVQFARSMAAVAPDFVTMALGTNDASNGVAASTFKTQTQSLITDLNNLPSPPSILLILPYRYASTSTTIWDAYRVALQQLATANANCDFLDLTATMPTTSAGGYYSSDALHPSDTGHAFIAARVAEALPAVAAVVTVAGGVTGAGTLSATSAYADTEAAALTGAGSLTATGTTAVVVNAALAVDGVLTAEVEGPPASTAVETFTYADGSPWPSTWTPTSSGGVGTQTVDVQGGRGRLVVSNNTWVRSRYSSAVNATDGGLLATIEITPGEYANGELFFNLSSDAGSDYRPDNGMSMPIYISQGTLGSFTQLTRNVNGVHSNIGYNEIPLDLRGKSRFKVRFEREGAEIRARIWDPATAEPTSWLIQNSNPTEVPVSIGKPGFSLKSQSGDPLAVFVDDVQIYVPGAVLPEVVVDGPMSGSATLITTTSSTLQAGSSALGDGSLSASVTATGTVTPVGLFGDGSLTATVTLDAPPVDGPMAGGASLDAASGGTASATVAPAGTGDLGAVTSGYSGSALADAVGVGVLSATVNNSQAVAVTFTGTADSPAGATLGTSYAATLDPVGELGAEVAPGGVSVDVEVGGYGQFDLQTVSASSADVALDTTGTLTAEVGVVDVPRAGQLDGTGALTAAVIVAPVVSTGALTAAAVLAATVTPADIENPTTAGAGDLAATAAYSTALPGGLPADGTLTAEVTIAPMVVEAQLDGITALDAGVGEQVAVLYLDLTSTGQLDATSTRGPITATGAMLGTGSSAASVAPSSPSDAPAGSRGDLAIGWTVAGQRDTQLDGAGTLTAVVVAEGQPTAADLTAAGDLSTVVVAARTEAPILDGAGQLAATVQTSIQAAADFTGTSTVATSVDAPVLVDVADAGTSDLGATVTLGAVTTPIGFSGAGALTATVSTAVAVAVNLDATTTGPATSTGAITADSTLTSTSYLDAGAAVTRDLPLDSAGTLAISAGQAATRAAGATGAGSLTATVSVGLQVDAVFAALGVTEIDAFADLVADVDLDGDAKMTAIGGAKFEFDVYGPLPVERYAVAVAGPTLNFRSIGPVYSGPDYTATILED